MHEAGLWHVTYLSNVLIKSSLTELDEVASADTIAKGRPALPSAVRIDVWPLEDAAASASRLEHLRQCLEILPSCLAKSGPNPNLSRMDVMLPGLRSVLHSPQQYRCSACHIIYTVEKRDEHDE